MSTKVLSQSENLQIFTDEVQANSPDGDLSDFSPGSMLDVIGGAIAAGQNEIAELVVTEFMKTYFSTAPGPTAEDPVDYLQKLAVDHFGDEFARPSAVKGTGSVVFTRPSDDAGAVLIQSGTIIKTVKDANGKEIRFKTTEAATITLLEKEVAVEAVDAGSAGNVAIGKITVVESTLTDPTISVNNTSATAGAADAPDDATYREIIKSLILSLAGATEAAVRGKARAVPGVAFADLVTQNKAVIEWDVLTMAPKVGETYFRIPYPVLYIADADGNSSQALIDAVKAAILNVRACGVKVDVKGAIPITLNWSGSITLDPDGPNYAELSEDPQKIIDTMIEYINTVLVIGSDFIRASANAYIMSVWGPAGTGDLTAFTTPTPVGDVDLESNQKFVAGTVQIV
jgi:hypothetical protein